MTNLAAAYPQLNTLQEATAVGDVFHNIAAVTHMPEYTPEYKAAEKAFIEWHRGHYPDPALDEPKKTAFGDVTERQRMFDNSAYQYANHPEKTVDDVSIRPYGEFSKSVSDVRATVPKEVTDYLNTLSSPDDYSS